MTNASWQPPDSSRAGATLETFILEGMYKSPAATGTFTSLLNQIALAAKLIAGRVRRAGLADVLGWTGETNVQGEYVQKLDVIANDTMISVLRRRGHCMGLASEELDDPVLFPDATGGYLVTTDPLDGSSNIDVDVSIGTIFGILRVDKSELPVETKTFLKPGRDLAAAGYVIYGSSTVLVLTTGQGVHGFTWDPSAGEFFLSHENIRCPKKGNLYSVNEGNFERWSEGVRRWNAHLKKLDKSDGRPYSHRYVGSLVADAHRTLLKGGIFAYPADLKNPNGKLRLLYEANPFAFIFEAAGGMASTGKGRVLDVVPGELHQRVPLIIGSTEDVKTFERFVSED
ncbi:MAG: class 1 fructose-bisphosphatase [Myxococcales bacterium]|nr:class 1 fructose-bisphosphatase [Myxococcales bacterium]MCB9583212.1 class 1 fructose-bisphosphatase [Polyangiaceae bacterium]